METQCVVVCVCLFNYRLTDSFTFYFWSFFTKGLCFSLEGMGVPGIRLHGPLDLVGSHTFCIFLNIVFFKDSQQWNKFELCLLDLKIFCTFGINLIFWYLWIPHWCKKISQWSFLPGKGGYRSKRLYTSEEP